MTPLFILSLIQVGLKEAESGSFMVGKGKQLVELEATLAQVEAEVEAVAKVGQQCFYLGFHEQLEREGEVK